MTMSKTMDTTPAPTIKTLEPARLSGGPRTTVVGEARPEAKRQVAAILRRALARRDDQRDYR